MQSAASMPGSSTPCIISSGFGEPLISTARLSSSSGSRLRIVPWLSFTTTGSAPASKAPAIAAFASAVISERASA